jgi:hypothetical protein
MADVDASVFHHLRDTVKGGFDEERFGSRIGFANLKRCADMACFCVFLLVSMNSGTSLHCNSDNGLGRPRNALRSSL